MEIATWIRKARRFYPLRTVLFLLHVLASSCLALRTLPAWRTRAAWGWWAWAAAGLAVGIVWGWWRTLALICATLYAWVGSKVVGQLQDNPGHRAGAEGYQGRVVENTIEALERFRERRQVWDAPCYVEVDVQETKDGALVLYHDVGGGLKRGFPPRETNRDVIRAVEGRGIPWSRARIRDLTLEEVQSMKLGEQSMAMVPTLDAFLSRCLQLAHTLTVAVEVKDLHSDKGRDAMVQSLATYKKARLDRHSQDKPSYEQFGWVCLLAFPSTFANCFGEFGSSEWQRWCWAFNEADVPVRSCVFHALDLTLFS
eukprot:scaffold625_cov324-Pavlova_lutheri.AAC.24